MPFKSQAQMAAAFGGYLGPDMKQKALGWAHETPNIKALPQHVKSPQHQALVNHYIRQGLKPHGPR